MKKITSTDKDGGVRMCSLKKVERDREKERESEKNREIVRARQR